VEIVAQRDFFLQIEPVTEYSPLAPIRCSRRYGRDCMRGPGHEIGRVSAQEIFASTIDALVYRRYQDPGYTTPVTDPLIAADVNEPPWDRRIPGCVLYADVGDTVAIQVRNGDMTDCHSLHVHGLRYGIDSDGAWPLGVQAKDGRRSDDIHPGSTWTYRFRATDETVGVWAFHDHHQMVQRWINRGLFGALIVRSPTGPRPDHEIPLFIHQLAGDVAADGFESPTLGNGASYPHTFGRTEQAYPYHCKIHGVTMAGTVTVQTGAPAAVSVVIGDNFFSPAAVTVAPGGTVTWFNNGHHDHIVFAGGGGGASFCLNGRSYVGNTPTIVARPGEWLRWYLVNLDVGDTWHNFHPHAARWQLPIPPDGAVDVHPLSPVEGFTIDTEVPQPLWLPPELDGLQAGHPPDDACQVPIRGDFLVHCHLEEHMMFGLAGLVRAQDRIWVTDAALDAVDIDLPYDDGNCCTEVDGTLPCGTGQHHPEMPGMGHHPMAEPMPGMGGMPMPAAHSTSVDTVLAETAAKGAWELLPCDSQTLAVHFALLHTGKVLIFSGSGNYPPRHDTHTYGSVLWDYDAGVFTPVPISYDVFCAGQATLPDGDLVAAGGTKNYDNPWEGAPEAALFDTTGEQWTNVASMADGRWYPTLVSLGDGTVIAFSGTNQAGTGLNTVPEVFHPDTGGWTATPHLRTPGWPLYPHLFLLTDGRLFFTGASLGNTSMGGQILTLATGTAAPVPGLTLADNRDQAASVLLPPAQAQRIMVMGGWGAAGATANTDIVDLSTVNPAYAPTMSMLHGRTRLNAVILPDRTVLVSGGGAGAESAPVLEAEIYDPQTGTWSAAATAAVPRLYHSVALLLPDGRVATAGSNPDRGDDELRIEIYHPPYLFRGQRPFIDDAPTDIAYGGQYPLGTPNARNIQWVQLIRPMATTHSCDSEQRLVDVAFTADRPCQLTITIPTEPNLAPPGWWMLTVVDTRRRPSNARWVHLTQS
jgi:FtsP/CotA-like multicopper oxidase with cupredoxin domain